MTLTFTMTLTFPMTVFTFLISYPVFYKASKKFIRHPYFTQSKIPLIDHGLFVTDNIYLFCLTPIYRVQMLEIIGVYPLMQNDRNTQPTTRAMNYRVNSRTGQFMGGLLV